MARPDSGSHRHAGSRSSYDSHRRDDDRYGRDRDRDRARDRDRERDRERDRDRDRDGRRGGYTGHRDYDRDDRSHRPRSRDRPRSRSPNRDRRRSRDRDYRKRDDDRDRKRRVDSSRDRNPKAESRPSTSHSNRGPTPQPSSKPTSKEEEQAKKRAKLEAWKAKQLAERERKAKEEAANVVNPAEAIMQGLRSTSATPAAPSPADSGPATDSGSPATHKKFDPKAVIKKATHGASQKGALGLDVSLPPTAMKSATNNNFKTNPVADKTKAANAASLTASSNQPATKVSGFGLAAGQTGDVNSKIGLDLEDEKAKERKLEKLSIPQFEDQDEDAALANGDEDDDNSPIDMDDQESAERARAALEARRAAEEDTLVNGEDDVDMEDAPVATDAVPQADETMQTAEQVEEEDVDPLDAYMNGLADDMETTGPTALKSYTRRKKGPEAIFAEESAYDEVFGGAEDDILAMAARKKAKKELKKVDHKKIEYEDFQKNFYTESDETKELTEEDVTNLRFEMEQINVRGKDIPKPVSRWSAMGLSAQVQSVIASLGYDKPTPIQAQAIPGIMSGRDLIGVAKTGSGKTMAFLLPMFRHIKAQRPLRRTKVSQEGPISIVLAPTRELANQIGAECKPFAKALGLNVAVCFGQASLKDNIDKIKLGVEIIVATPGRLIDLATVNSGNLLSFQRVTYIVLDEADRLWDLGFAPQVKMILSQIRPDRQFVMFSATFPNNLEVLAKEVLKERPMQITIGGRATVAKEITLEVEVLPRTGRLNKLLGILGDVYMDADFSALNRQRWEVQTLIFVERQEAASELLGALMKRGFTKISYLHGGREQDERAAAIEDFKNGFYPILIATSVAARGLDVKSLKYVINYDVPRHLEDFVHRAGRTGRAGNTGTCITFLTPDDEPYAADVVKAFKYSEREVPPAVEEMSNSYKKKIKSGAVQRVSRGFGGKGVDKLDAARDLERLVLRKEHGLEVKKPEEYVDPDEVDGEPASDIVVHARDDEKKEKDEGVAVKTPGKTPEPAKAAVAAPPEKAVNNLYASLDEYNIKVHKREVAAPVAAPKDPLALARLRAAELGGGRRVGGGTSAGPARENKGPDAGAFHATLEINDHPQKARWAVTNRTNVKNILDNNGVSITSKGVFYKLGDGPKSETDAPKLYLLVEGDTESSVMSAMRDLVRLLKEGIVQDMEAASRAPRAAGRYSLI